MNPRSRLPTAAFVVGGDLAGRSRTVTVLLDAWRQVARAETTTLAGITFADLVERSRAVTEPMYYI
ncbi:MAG: hypothetical protein EBX36_03390 [Planctomycetia bacterium]|nr:hypothetical protein [Planctomycetia bacterium]